MLEINKIHLGNSLQLMLDIPSESVNLILTDPPYRTGMTANASLKDTHVKLNRQHKKTRLVNMFDDSFTDEEYNALAKGCAEQWLRVLTKDAGCYVFMGWRYLNVWTDALANAGFNVKEVIVWDKERMGLGSEYRHQYELLIYAVKGDFRANTKNSEYITNVWRVYRKQQKSLSRTMRSDFHHETEKQENLVRIILEQASKENDVILDCFAGGGSIPLICLKMNRNFIAIELMEKFQKLAQEKIDSFGKQGRLSEQA